MNKKFRWNQIPKTPLGFVDYRVIPSHPIRVMVGEAELVKLKEEYKAKVQWVQTKAVSERLDSIEKQINYIDEVVLEPV